MCDCEDYPSEGRMDLTASGSGSHKRLDDLTIQLEDEEEDANVL